MRRALRATDQRAQAVAVLEQASIRNPQHMPLLGAYGRALADAGDYQQALDVSSTARIRRTIPTGAFSTCRAPCSTRWAATPKRSGITRSALKIVPDEPSVLSNLGLSYALTKDLKRAEVTLRRAVAQPNAGPKVRQNLALVVGLQGRFAEAEKIASADLPTDEAAANVAYLRQMLAQQGRLEEDRGRPGYAEPGARRRHPDRYLQAMMRLTIVLAALLRRQFSDITLIAAGPRMTTNSTGRKNRIIGTVSFGGRPAAFFSASDMRMSRFSCAITRSIVASGVP